MRRASVVRGLLLALLLGPAASPLASAQGEEPPPAATQYAAADLTSLSLDELVNLKVSTVSRKPEPWWAASSGIDIVTGEDIRRAGALNLPDALRLATGMHVGQPSKRSWAVSLRGMNVLAANKISVVMDGRSLFTPFFSGVLWDAQDTLLEDVDRIEVVRGPVGALWGAFAVNGFVQILTKPAWDTEGLFATAGTGTEDPGFFGLRYGGKVSRETYYRAYAKYFQTDWTYGADGEHAQPATDFLQTGFRVDARRFRDSTVTLQGAYYTNEGLPLARETQTDIWGTHVLGRWQRTFSSESSLRVEGYFDHTYRLIPANFEERRSTGSASIQYQRRAGRHGLIAGFDALVSGDEIGNEGVAQMDPPRRTIHTLGAYARDTFQLAPRASLVLGVKSELSSFAGHELQPTLRFAWAPNAETTAWAAVSRSVRTPVRIDEDLVFRFGGVTLFEANDDFQTENAGSVEVGARHRPASALTVDLSMFTYRYDELRSTEPPSAGSLATFRNGLNAKSYGAELAVMYQPVPRLLLKGRYRYLDLRFTRDADSRDTTRGSAEGNDPKHVAVVGAQASLPANVELDAFLRLASALPNPALEGYTTVDARLGWRPTSHWEIAVLGRNLLEPRYAEFVTTNSLNELVSRSIAVKVTLRR